MDPLPVAPDRSPDRSARRRPRIVVSMGDPAGIGPEVVAVAASDQRVDEACELSIVGDASVLEVACSVRGVRIPTGSLIDLALVSPSVTADTDHDAARGEASFAYVARALDEVLVGHADAVTTAPISKAAWHAAGHRYPGHTEYVAERAGGGLPAMMLVTGPLASVLVTAHIPLREVFAALTPERVLRTIELAHIAGSRLVGGTPRIGVAGVNPHAGEGGILGTEDDQIIGPAVQTAQRSYDVSGPHAADGLYRQATAGRYDVVVAMYHDQGLIPAKVFGHGVNVTLGTPLVRTSPDHGTAFDIAGTGKADAESMVQAILMAARLSS